VSERGKIPARPHSADGRDDGRDVVVEEGDEEVGDLGSHRGVAAREVGESSEHHGSRRIDGHRVTHAAREVFDESTLQRSCVAGVNRV
jgi:hypothetical protein